MPKGLPKSIIKKYGISKKAWSVFRGRKKSRVSNPKTKRRKTTRMARRRRRGRRSYSMTIPIAPIAGLAAGLAHPIKILLAPEHNVEWAMNELCKNYTGFNFLTNTWNAADMEKGLLPLVAGLLVHKFVGGPPLNLNRTLGRARVPFIRI